MMNTKKNLVLLGGILLSAPAVMAHPGHGTFSGHELWHYLTSPVHAGIGLGAVAVAVAAWRYWRWAVRAKKRS